MQRYTPRARVSGTMTTLEDTRRQLHGAVRATEAAQKTMQRLNDRADLADVREDMAHGLARLQQAHDSIVAIMRSKNDG